MNRLAVLFTAPGQVSLQGETLPDPAPDQVLVQTLYSAISPGTEMLIYRGLFPEELRVDESLPALTVGFHYPLHYGYSAVGQVVEVGAQVEAGWMGRMVFAFQPHASHFLARPGELQPLPEGIEPEEAVFLPNMETAVNLCMDGAPLLGERVVVFGQGVVGLLTTAVLAQFPLASLISLDAYPMRREASQQIGVHLSLDPHLPDVLEHLRQNQPDGADLSFELSGSPEALDQAIAATGYAGRVVVGSWYGKKRAALDLGGRFHRSRIRLISSQVSSIAPELSGRWTKERRFELAWEMLRRVQPRRLITHCLPVREAQGAYQMLDQSPEQAIQIVFQY